MVLFAEKGEKFLDAHKKRMGETMRAKLSELTVKEQEQLENILMKVSR